MNLRERAIAAYKDSAFWENDIHARAAEKEGLRELLRYLGADVEDVEPENSTIEVDGVIIDAFYRPANVRFRDARRGAFQGSVYFCAHEKCSRCGQMRHSGEMSGGIGIDLAAAALGRWLLLPHQCPPSEGGAMGLREAAQRATYNIRLLLARLRPFGRS